MISSDLFLLILLALSHAGEKLPGFRHNVLSSCTVSELLLAVIGRPPPRFPTVLRRAFRFITAMKRALHYCASGTVVPCVCVSEMLQTPCAVHHHSAISPSRVEVEEDMAAAAVAMPPFSHDSHAQDTCISRLGRSCSCTCSTDSRPPDLSANGTKTVMNLWPAWLPSRLPAIVSCRADARIWKT